MRKSHIDIITMGCSKNLIDSERLLKRLDDLGYTAVHNPEIPSGEFVVVNTCGFIGDAKEESVNMILQLSQLKKEGKIGQIVVMGCLSERYRNILPSEIPEVDHWYGKFDWTLFLDSLKQKGKKDTKIWERKLTTPPWSAYVKISEGCDRMCAYCAIPLITGRHKSRPEEEIIEEVKSLADKGVKEFNIIAQDLSSYGLDLYGSHRLPSLLERMAVIPGVEWIRLHYLYPTDFPMEILDVMNRHDNICRYIDIALQHISDKVLTPMNRKVTKKETLALLRKIRETVPGIHIRTTIMTGFPGEDEESFEELKEFVGTQRFERLGGFAYSEEEDTLAAKTFPDIISGELKEKRLSEIMDLQEEISLHHNESFVGKRLKVLVEELSDGFAIARSEFDSPEVDQEIIVTDCNAEPGEFITVEITEASAFELKSKQL